MGNRQGARATAVSAPTVALFAAAGLPASALGDPQHVRQRLPHPGHQETKFGPGHVPLFEHRGRVVEEPGGHPQLHGLDGVGGPGEVAVSVADKETGSDALPLKESLALLRATGKEYGHHD